MLVADYEILQGRQSCRSQTCGDEGATSKRVPNDQEAGLSWSPSLVPFVHVGYS